MVYLSSSVWGVRIKNGMTQHAIFTLRQHRNMKNTPVCLSESCEGPQFRDVSRARRYYALNKLLEII